MCVTISFFLLTRCGIQGKAATPRLDHSTRWWTVRPVHTLLHSFRGTSLKLLQETVYLCLYTRRGSSHRFHRNTKNKHNTLTSRKIHFTLYNHPLLRFLFRLNTKNSIIVPHCIIIHHYSAEFVHRPEFTHKISKKTAYGCELWKKLFDNAKILLRVPLFIYGIENKATPTDIYRSY